MSFKSSKLGGTLVALQKHLYVKLITPLVPALVGEAEVLPKVDSELIASQAADFILRGPIEAYFAMLGGIMALNSFCLVSRGKQIKSLPLEEQKAFFIKALDSKIWAFRGLSVLSGLPLKVIYYNQSEVCESLGFHRQELIEEALKHPVTRDSQPAQVNQEVS